MSRKETFRSRCTRRFVVARDRAVSSDACTSRDQFAVGVYGVLLMWIVRVALDRPYTFIVLAVLILVLSPVMILRTPTDIFPNIDIPVIAVAWQFTGMNPEELEGRLTSGFERVLTTTVDNIEHIESTTVNGQAIVKIYLQHGASLDTANAQVTAISQTALRQLPPGTLPPLIINYSASSVPILQLGLSDNGLPEQQFNDLGQNFLRHQLGRASCRERV